MPSRRRAIRSVFSAFGVAADRALPLDNWIGSNGIEHRGSVSGLRADWWSAPGLDRG